MTSEEWDALGDWAVIVACVLAISLFLFGVVS